MRKTDDQWAREWDIEPGDPVTGSRVHLRIIQPSEPYGGWAGSDYVIREWCIVRSGQEIIGRPTADEILALETWLGEIDSYRLCDHPSLGLVAGVDAGGVRR